MSTRATILDTLAVELAKIATDSGYSTNVREVKRDLPYAGNLPYADPCLTIIDLGPDEDRQYCGSGKVRSVMQIQIVAQVMGATLTTPPSAETNAIIADVRKCIDAPINLGANVRYVEMLGIPEVFIESRVGIVRLPIEICYWWSTAAP